MSKPAVEEKDHIKQMVHYLEKAATEVLASATWKKVAKETEEAKNWQACALWRSERRPQM